MALHASQYPPVSRPPLLVYPVPAPRRTSAKAGVSGLLLGLERSVAQRVRLVARVLVAAALAGAQLVDRRGSHRLGLA